MSATSIASRSTSILRAATRRSLISPRPRNPNPSSSPHRQPRIEASSSPPRFIMMLRRELSTQQPFHSVVAAAYLVSKLPSDVTSFEGKFVNYVSPI